MRKILFAATILFGFAMSANAERFIQGDLGYAVQPSWTDHRDNSFSFDAGIGYDFGQLAVVGTYIRTPGTNGNGVDADIGVISIQASPYTVGNFKPFAEAGIGYGYFGGPAVKNTNGITEPQESPVFEAGLGTTFAFTPRAKIVAEAKFLTTSNTVTVDNTNKSSDYSSIVLTSGIRYSF